MNDDPAIIDVELELKTDTKSLDDYARQIRETLEKATHFENYSGEKGVRQVVDDNIREFERLRSEFANTYHQIAAEMNNFKSTKSLEGRIDSITNKIKSLNAELKESVSDQGKAGAYINIAKKDQIKYEREIIDLKEQANEAAKTHKKIIRETETEYKEGNITYNQYVKALSTEAKTHEDINKEIQRKISNNQRYLESAQKTEVEERQRARAAYQTTKAVQNQIQALETEKSQLEVIKSDDAQRVRYNQALTEEFNRQFGRRVKELGQKREEAEQLAKSSEEFVREAHDEYVENERVTKEKERQKQLEQEQLALERAKRQEQANYIRSLTRQKAELKQNAAQWYYVLRALKMAKFALDNMAKSTSNFLKSSVKGVDKTTKRWWKLVNVFGSLAKYIWKAGTAFKNLKKNSDSARKSHDGLVTSFRKGFLMILKYVFGIRSLFFLFNRLRNALATGMENLATQYKHVDDQMSNLISSLERMKNAIAAMVQPLLNILVPALEKLSASFSKASVSIASFFAALSGQDFVYMAKKIEKRYIDDEKAKKKDEKATKKLNDETDRQLSNLDKLNVLTSPKDKTEEEEEESPISDMFDIVPIENKFKDLIKKIKDFLKPISKAWAKEAEFVKNAWKYAIKEVGALLKKMWEDFKRVWFQDATQRIFENIFHIIGDIGLIVGNLAKRFREAWGENENGYRILMAIRNIILVITEGLRKAADYTAEWSDKLNFTPLLTAIADVLNQQIVPAVQKVVDLFEQLYEDVVLELLRYFVESFGPILVKVFGNIAETIGNLAKNFTDAWNEGNRGKRIIKALEDIFDEIGEIILDVSEQTKEWAKTVNFAPALDAVYDILKALKKPITFIVRMIGKFWTDVILPFWKDFAEKGLPKLRDMVQRIVDRIDWDKLESLVTRMFEVISSFLSKYGDFLLLLIEKIANYIIDLVNSGKLEEMVDYIGQLIENADPNRVADFAIQVGKVAAAIWTILTVLSKTAGVLVTIISIANVFKQGIVLNAVKNLTKQISAAQAAAEAASGTAVAGAGASAAAIAGVIAVVLLVVAAVATLWSENAQFRDNVKSIWDEITKSIKDSCDSIVESVNSLGFEFENVSEIIKSVWTELCNALGPMFEGVFKYWAEEIEAFGLHISGLIQMITGALNKDWDQVQDGMRRFNEGTTKDITSRWSGILQTLKGYSNDYGIEVDKTESKSESLINSQDKIADSTQKVADKMVILNDNMTSLSNNTAFEDLNSDLPVTVVTFDNTTKAVDETTQSIEDFNIQLTEIPDTAEEVSKSMEDVMKSWIDSEDSLAGKVRSFTDELNKLADNSEENSKKIEESFDSMFQPFRDANIALDDMSDFSEIPKNLSDGFEEGWNEEFGKDGEVLYSQTSASFTGFIKKIKELFGIASPSTVFAEMGKNLILGLSKGINDEATINLANTSMNNLGNKIIRTANTILTSKALVNTGKNLIAGLVNGITQSTDNAVNAIRNLANRTVNEANDAFMIHSPSKIFEEIGEFITKGLAIGVEEDTDDVTDAFEELVPSSEFLDVFYDKFISMLSNLREESISIVTSMIDEIESIVARIDNLAVLDTLSSQLANVSKIEIPDIALGYKLPENEKFTQTQTMDMSKLPSILKAAFIEAFTEIDALQSDGGDTIIEIDGNEVFRVVRKENDKYKKQTGVSALT